MTILAFCGPTNSFLFSLDVLAFNTNVSSLAMILFLKSSAKEISRNRCFVNMRSKHTPVPQYFILGPFRCLKAVGSGLHSTISLFTAYSKDGYRSDSEDQL